MKLIFGLFVLLLVSCAPESSNYSRGVSSVSPLVNTDLLITECDTCITGSFNQVGNPIVVRTFFVETLNDLQTLSDQMGRPHVPNVQGFAYFNSEQCDIYLVYPRNNSGSNVLVLGHEMLHCILGQFHPQ